jgi:hypothetical protein
MNRKHGLVLSFCLASLAFWPECSDAQSQDPKEPATQSEAAKDPRVPAQDAVFSGPQVDEELAPLKMILGLGDQAGRTIDPVAGADAKPIVLVFVHDVNRQTISMTRILTNYTLSRSKEGLHSAVVLLAEDTTGAINTLKRIQHALTANVPTGVSPDGLEGPGEYGLNRSVQMTILVANKNRVTANFALIQPSLQVDLPNIVRAVIAQIGGPEPKLSDLLQSGGVEANRGMQSTPDPEAIRSLVRPLIQLNARDDQVDKAAQAIEEAVEKSPQVRKEIGRIARTIVSSGKLENYGTARAQGYLKQWAEKHGQDLPGPRAEPKSPDSPDSKKAPDAPKAP